MTSRAKEKRDALPRSPERALLDGQRAFLGFLAKRLGSRADAEDVLQDFSLRVLARRDQLHNIDRMDAWLYAILRSTLNDHYRKAARQNRLAKAVAAEPEDWAGDAAEEMARMCTCSGGLIFDLRDADAELIRRIDFGEEDRAAVPLIWVSTATRLACDCIGRVRHFAMRSSVIADPAAKLRATTAIARPKAAKTAITGRTAALPQRPEGETRRVRVMIEQRLTL